LQADEKYFSPNRVLLTVSVTSFPKEIRAIRFLFDQLLHRVPALQHQYSGEALARPCLAARSKPFQVTQLDIKFSSHPYFLDIESTR
jgi:hypothetical protein